MCNLEMHLFFVAVVAWVCWRRQVKLRNAKLIAICARVNVLGKKKKMLLEEDVPKIYILSRIWKIFGIVVAVAVFQQSDL